MWLQRHLYIIAAALLLLPTGVPAAFDKAELYKPDKIEASSDEAAALNWIDKCHSENVELRAEAARHLGLLGRGGKAELKVVKLAVPALVGLLNDPDPRVRKVATVALQPYGPHAKKAVPLLAAIIRENGDVDAAWFAAETIGCIGADAKAAVPTLISALRVQSSGNGPSLQEYACTACGSVGPAAKEALPALRVAAAKAPSSVRVAAAKAIWRIDPGEDISIETFRKMLKSGDLSARKAAVSAIGELLDNTTDVQMRARLTELARIASHDGDEAIRSLAEEIIPK
jgi:HEAT repeat protein